MKVTIRGPEGHKVDLTKEGKYMIRKKIGAGHGKFKDTTIFVERFAGGNNQEPLESMIVAIGHSDVSTNHLGFYLDKDSILLVDDRPSTFGSYINMEPIKRSKTIREPGDYVLRLGGTLFDFKVRL